MSKLEEIKENREINSWVKQFIRAPHQINRSHESDAELIELEGNGSRLLAVSIDSVSEEVAFGLYRNPFTLGWITVMASFSDLAAVGAEPLGMVVAVAIESERSREFREAIAKGVSAACQELGVFVLGGDTNTSPALSLTGCALGLVDKKHKMLRRGCRAGDVVFLSGQAGKGNALGLVRLSGLAEGYFSEESYRPIARLQEGRLIREYATCCMDTSDGLLITLDQLMRVNKLGFQINAGWENILAPEVVELCRKTKVPFWFMAAGIHGEFELVFTVPSGKIEAFMKDSKNRNFHPIQLGRVQHSPDLKLAFPSGEAVVIDMAPLRNLWANPVGDMRLTMQEYHRWGRKWGLG